MKQVTPTTQEIREESVFDWQQRTMRWSWRASSIQPDQPDQPREERVETQDGSHDDFKETLGNKANCLFGWCLVMKKLNEQNGLSQLRENQSLLCPHLNRHLSPPLHLRLSSVTQQADCVMSRRGKVHSNAVKTDGQCCWDVKLFICCADHDITTMLLLLFTFIQMQIQKNALELFPVYLKEIMYTRT